MISANVSAFSIGKAVGRGGGGLGPFDLQYVVVAGGASGGGNFANNYIPGGGGAGGLLSATNLTLEGATAYALTVGAGGAIYFNNGSNSTFHTITSTGGGAGGAYQYANGQNLSLIHI